MSGSASSSSAWPTPAANEARQGFQQRPAGLASQQDQQSLSTIAAVWPTPIKSDAKGGPLGKTIIRRDGTTQSRATGGTLAYATEQMWRTPGATDSERGSNGTWVPDPKAGQHSLRHQTRVWRTPRSHEAGQYSRDHGNPDKPTPTLTGQAFSLPDRPISTDGEEYSRIRRTLNPLFVEWLMGWPPGWTSLALTPPASTGSACSATGLSAWKRRTRSALSSLASPHAVPLRQLDFFS